MPPVQTRPRLALDRARIVDAALDIVDRDGLDALSMRKLGGVLGVEAMALYHYFPSKAMLVDAIVAFVLARLQVPELVPDLPWTGVVRQVAGSFRTLGRDHPNVFPMLATIGLDNPASLAPAEAVLSVLTRAGLSPRDAFDAFIALKSYVVGYALWEIGSITRRSDPAVCVEVDDLESLSEQPVLSGIAEWLTQRSVDAEFEAGLGLLIEGIRRRLDARADAV
ncbi:MAG: hypothetical protein NVSMB2_22140 [Chloroflexota bacterium]